MARLLRRPVWLLEVFRSTFLAADASTLGILRGMQLPRFEDLAASADATLDLLALALAAAFGRVDAARALATLDGLGAEVARVLDSSARTPRAERSRSRTCWAQFTASPGTPSSTT